MANLISLLRAMLCMVVAGLLFLPSQAVYLTCFFLTAVVIWMDGLDGYVARKFNESSKSGAVVDIVADRVVEQIYWITFLALGWVPVWVPLFVVIRGILVDGVRGLAFEKGLTAFGQTTMMTTPLGKFLAASPFSRWTYAFTKALAFGLLILAHTPGLPVSITAPSFLIGNVSVYVAVLFCAVRGLPVILEGRRFLFSAGS